MPSVDVNWLAVVVATIAAMVLGFLWYGPIFGRIWLAGMGKTQEEMSGNNLAIPISALTAFVTALGLAVLLGAVGANTIAEGVVWGLFSAFVFIAMSQINNAIYEGRNSTVTGLYVAYQLVTLAVMGAIIAAWQ